MIERLRRCQEPEDTNRQTLTEEQICDSLGSGKLIIRCVLLECVQFNSKFYEELVVAANNHRSKKQSRPRKDCEDAVDPQTKSAKRPRLDHDQDLPSDDGGFPETRSSSHNIDDMYA